MANDSVIYKGPGICSLLGLAFIVLKLCNVITWSWWWVLAPFWIPLGIIAIVLLVCGIGLLAVIWKS